MKQMTPFDHLKNLHTKKKNWDDFNDEEKKNFNIYIINKALSFNPNSFVPRIMYFSSVEK